jgi:hypothetical protein
LPNCDDGPSRDLWLDYGWAERPYDPEQLYDNVFDPVQLRNVVNLPEFEGVRTDLSTRLDARMRATNDPLLNGPVPVPPGAMVNDLNAQSATDDLWLAEEDGELRRIPNPQTVA